MDLAELEAELKSCEEALAKSFNGESKSPIKYSASLTIPQSPSRKPAKTTPQAATTTAATSPPHRSKTMNDLLNLLQNAPDGPIELDTALIYSPTASEKTHTSSAYQYSPRSDFSIPAFNASGNYFEDQNNNASSSQHRWLPEPSNNRQLNDETASIQAAERSSRYPQRPNQNSSNPNPPGVLSRQAKYQQRMEQLRQARDAEETAECTFAPQTGRGPSSPYAQKHRVWLPVHQRLSALTAVDDQRKQAAVRRVVEEKRAKEEAECTFAPKLIAEPKLNPSKHRLPVYERSNEVRELKELRIAQATARADEEATFKPKLNEKSLQLAKELKERRPKEKRNKYVPEAPTFAPQINKASERLLALSSEVPSEFDARVRHYQERAEERLRHVAEEEDARECTFRPDTGNATTILAFSDNPGCLFETPSERWHRMAIEEAQKQEAKRAAVAAEYQYEATFEPNLNRKSLKIAEGRTLTDLVAEADMARAKLHILKENTEEQRKRDCTFAPDTSKPKVMGYYGEYELPVPNAKVSIAAALKEGPDALAKRLAEQRHQRERRAEELKAQQEVKELADCTFAPNTVKPAVSQPRGPVVVRGMDRFLETKLRAERQQLEAEERAAKVFHLRPKCPRGVTIPQPFNLAGEARRKQLQERKLQGQSC